MTRQLSFATLLACLMLKGSLYNAAVVDYEKDGGAISGVDNEEVCWANGAALNKTLASLKEGDIFVVPANRTFYLMGGIISENLFGVVLHFDGNLVYSQSIRSWPRDSRGTVLDCLKFVNASSLLLTSSAIQLGEDKNGENEEGGVMDGRGKVWWGVPGFGYLVRGENRPKLLVLDQATNVTVERLFLKDSPYWTFLASSASGLEVRESKIHAARTGYDGHDLIDMTAFNTDGFDVTGRNVWIHDCEVWNQDDTIAVKDDSQDMLFERITASGVGLTIGSIGNSGVRNITFRDCTMPQTYKGIYMKFRDSSPDAGGTIADVTFENIRIEEPSQWPIWIGPAQQSDSSRLCAAHPCSICWPELPEATCGTPGGSTYVNITLRNVTVVNPKLSPGVILANSSAPMVNVLFEDVVFENPPIDGVWGTDYFKCENVLGGVATGKTWPVPPCFEDRTNTRAD